MHVHLLRLNHLFWCCAQLILRILSSFWLIAGGTFEVIYFEVDLLINLIWRVHCHARVLALSLLLCYAMSRLVIWHQSMHLCLFICLLGPEICPIVLIVATTEGMLARYLPLVQHIVLIEQRYSIIGSSTWLPLINRLDSERFLSWEDGLRQMGVRRVLRCVKRCLLGVSIAWVGLAYEFLFHKCLELLV